MVDLIHDKLIMTQDVDMVTDGSQDFDLSSQRLKQYSHLRLM